MTFKKTLSFFHDVVASNQSTWLKLVSSQIHKLPTLKVDYKDYLSGNLAVFLDAASRGW